MSVYTGGPGWRSATIYHSATASWFIKEAVEAGEIIPYDPNAAPKMMRYIPWWAAPDGRST